MTDMATNSAQPRRLTGTSCAPTGMVCRRGCQRPPGSCRNAACGPGPDMYGCDRHPRSAADPPRTTPAEVARFESAYRDCGRAVLGYALRRAASREDALDAVAETFATAWRRRADMPDDPDEVRPWLFAVAPALPGKRQRARPPGPGGSARRWPQQCRATDRPDPPRPAARATAPSTDRARRPRELPDHDRELVTLVAWRAHPDTRPPLSSTSPRDRPGPAAPGPHPAPRRTRHPARHPARTSAHQEDLR